MLKIISANLWKTIREKATRAENRRAAIAYVSDPSLLPLQGGDLLVTDASDASIAGGRTSAVALEQYLKSGAELFCLADLHAKVLVLDDWAVIGSANASKHSAFVCVEAAVVTDRPDLVGQADKLVSFLAKTGVPIDEAFVTRILKIPVSKATSVPSIGRRRKQIKPSLDQKFWLISLREEATYPGDADKVEAVAQKVQKKVDSKSGIVDWFWWSGNARFSTEARKGDVVVECLRPRSKISTTRSIRVYKHGRIDRVFQEPGVKAKTFHCVWPADYDDSAVSWYSFLDLARRAGITRTLSYRSTVELTAQQSSALFELWPQ